MTRARTSIEDHYAVDDSTGCWIWNLYKTNLGYGKKMVRDGTSVKAMRAHRWMYEIVCGYHIPDGYELMHLCDNPSCVNPSHMRPGTRKDNAMDMARKIRGTVKVSPDQVREIRRLRAEGLTLCEIAGRYPIKFGAVHQITTGKTWRHVT